ncbi:hypothetical protein D3C83_146980 [compost metagenome]
MDGAATMVRGLEFEELMADGASERRVLGELDLSDRRAKAFFLFTGDSSVAHR